MANRTLIRRIILKNFKSISYCDVSLGALTYLVGANGSGKSNFLDALHFVKDALSRSLDIALRERGGLREVQQRSGAGGRPRHFGISIDLLLPDGRSANYYFEIGSIAGGGYAVQHEYCEIQSLKANEPSDYFQIQPKIPPVTSLLSFPAVLPDSLALLAVSGTPAFHPVYEALRDMGFYNLNPRKMRDPQPPLDGSQLDSDGGNIASVISYIDRKSPDNKALIEQYLNKVVPSIRKVAKIAVGPMETLKFQQCDTESYKPVEFTAQNMSDGTLRALGVLTSLFQHGAKDHSSLIAIEEPETALHPGASAALRSALRRASEQTQVIVTSHSPDLLDSDEVTDDQIRFVEFEAGETKIADIDPSSRDAIRSQLFSAGELLRINQLSLDVEKFQAIKDKGQMNLFEEHVRKA
jgi:predicted ATPase